MEYILFAAIVTVAAAAVILALHKRSNSTITQLSIQLSTFQERLAGKDQMLLELKKTSEQVAAELQSANTLIQDYNTRLAASLQLNKRIPELEAESQNKTREIQDLQSQLSDTKSQLAKCNAELESERNLTTERLALLQEAQTKLGEAFSSLSSQALKDNNKTFLETANALLHRYMQSAEQNFQQRQQAIAESVAPLKESLEKVDKKIHDLESARISAYASLTQHLQTISSASEKLQTETAQLVKALRQPVVRGRWGEIQLRRVVELAGMSDYCDFSEQESVQAETGRLRPDMIVKLPGGKTIIVDAKAPLHSYIEALETQQDEERKSKLQAHAQAVRGHINSLSNKAYWDQFTQTPEFVILFLPGETFFSAALEFDHELIEYGVERKVILANPTTLIALLKAIAYGWRQEHIAQNALEISRLGKDLYDRIKSFSEHLFTMKRNLKQTVEAFNNAVGSFEGRVLPSARRFKELGAATGDDINLMDSVDVTPREIQKHE